MNLRCPYCGEPFAAVLEYTGGAYSEHRDLSGYECESWECDAAWDRDGNLTKAPQPIRSVSCLRPSCGGLLHTVNRTDPDGNVDRVEFCSTCGTPAG